MRGRFTPGGDGRRVVRAPAARAHPSLHRRAAARRDRAGRRARLPALPVRAGSASRPTTRMEGPGGARRRRRRSSKASRRRPAPGRARSCRRGIDDYEPAWLDDLCLAGPRRPGRGCGRAAGRQTAATRGASPVRTTPIALLARRHAPLWTALSHRQRRAADARPARRRRCSTALREHGASFFDELVDEHAACCAPQVEEALAELVALGLVTSDSFAGLRALLRAGRQAQAASAAAAAGAGPPVRHGGCRPLGAGARRAAGRPAAEAEREAVEHVARTLLRRYGVVFWRLLEREAAWLPPWRDLLRVFRRLEARGEIRGGRFVAGFAGEQFALPEAVGALREVRRRPQTGDLVSISGADPLNLVGILTPEPKLAGADRQPPALPRRPPHRLSRRRRGAVSRCDGSRDRVGGAQGIAASGPDPSGGAERGDRRCRTGYRRRHRPRYQGSLRRVADR